MTGEPTSRGLSLQLRHGVICLIYNKAFPPAVVSRIRLAARIARLDSLQA